MAFVKTLDVLNAMKAALAALTADDGSPLFEVVEYFASNQLALAIQQLAIAKERVCFIVPTGDGFNNTEQGRIGVLSRATMNFDLLIADRDWAAKGHQAAFGGSDNLGVISMKDRVRDDLTGQTLGLPYIALLPLSGNFLSIADPKKKDSPGRECWIMTFETPAGDTRVAVI